jgi:hypothetical protein
MKKIHFEILFYIFFLKTQKNLKMKKISSPPSPPPPFSGAPENPEISRIFETPLVFKPQYIVSHWSRLNPK